MYRHKYSMILIIFMTCCPDQILGTNSTNGTITNFNGDFVNTTSGTTRRPISQTSEVANISTADGARLQKYWQAFQNVLLNPNIIGVVQKQIGNFIQSNNVSFPISIMTPGNLQKVLQLLGSGSSNQQGLSQYAGQLANIPNEIQNLGDGLSQNISSQCNSDIQIILSELMNRKQWAIQLIDAAGKIPAGLLDGNMMWTGSYDECLAVHAGKFDGKYCMASLPLTDILGSVTNFPGGFTVKIGICVPNSCTALESKTVINLLLEMIPLGQSTLQTTSVGCSEPLEYDAVGIAGLTVCCVFATLMILSTLFDVVYYQKKSKEKVLSESIVSSENQYQIDSEVTEQQIKSQQTGMLTRLAMTFSVYTNGKKLLNTEQGSGALTAINGIRFLSISWVVLGHAFSSARDQMQNLTYISEFINNWTSMVIVNALLSVDSFFALSGLLVSYLFMKEMKREKGRINWFMFYFHRFWRLTPAYMLVIFLDMSLFPYLGEGPFFTKGGPDGELCRKFWWKNILYINNVVNPKEMCFPLSWYLANDMQFYVVSPLLLVPLYFSKKIGIAVNALALLGITIASGVISSHYGLLPTLMSADVTALMGQYSHYIYKYYMVPWCRMGPYIVGIVTGYTIYQTNGQYKIPKVLNLLIWLVMAVIACVVLYGISGPVNGHLWDNGVTSLYNALHRSVWGMCVCWVIFACVTGNGGIVNDFLSWKLFVPLGRLSYCIYLTHILVINYYFQTMRQPLYGTTLEYTFIFLGCLVLSILTATVATLAFETPMMALEKIIFRRGTK
ncbi:nose resistant to fluoxetine protein 6-like [Argopecten irradians]|uniref:nose resistant to fluoxetine protein 6-like n=1 Tax=Argopecten irradians TaxID=31199 RepID=UPI003710E0A4